MENPLANFSSLSFSSNQFLFSGEQVVTIFLLIVHEPVTIHCRNLTILSSLNAFSQLFFLHFILSNSIIIVIAFKLIFLLGFWKEEARTHSQSVRAQALLLLNNDSVSMGCIYSLELVFEVSLDIFSEVELLGHKADPLLIF